MLQSDMTRLLLSAIIIISLSPDISSCEALRNLQLCKLSFEDVTSNRPVDMSENVASKMFNLEPPSNVDTYNPCMKGLVYVCIK